MAKHILCSIDLTHIEDAKGLILEAKRQASLDDAKITIMTVIPDYGSSWVGSFFKEGTLLKATEVANQTLIKLIAEVLPDNQNVHRRVKVGVVYEKVLLTIKKLDVDLVIIGAHKPTVIDHLMGPNAARIVRVSPVSTMVVRLN